MTVRRLFLFVGGVDTILDAYQFTTSWENIPLTNVEGNQLANSYHI